MIDAQPMTMDARRREMFAEQVVREQFPEQMRGPPGIATYHMRDGFGRDAIAMLGYTDDESGLAVVRTFAAYDILRGEPFIPSVMSYDAHNLGEGVRGIALIVRPPLPAPLGYQQRVSTSQITSLYALLNHLHDKGMANLGINLQDIGYHGERLVPTSFANAQFAKTLPASGVGIEVPSDTFDAARQQDHEDARTLEQELRNATRLFHEHP